MVEGWESATRGNRYRELYDPVGCPGLEVIEPYKFAAQLTLYAEYANVERPVEGLRGDEAVPVAICSGTLNDIVKRASYALRVETTLENVCGC